MATLNGIPLPRNLVWGDQLDYSTIKQTVNETVTGHLVIQRGRMNEGRPITLTAANKSSWLTRTQADAIAALRLEDDPLTLNYDGRLFNVRFKLSEADHFVVRSVEDGTPHDASDALCYIERIALFEVLS